jgi:hypothetical protein
MNEEEMRRATAAGVTDAFDSIAKGVFIAGAIFTFFMHPLIGTALLLGWLVLWLVWRTLRWIVSKIARVSAQEAGDIVFFGALKAVGYAFLLGFICLCVYLVSPRGH